VELQGKKNPFLGAGFFVGKNNSGACLSTGGLGKKKTERATIQGKKKKTVMWTGTGSEHRSCGVKKIKRSGQNLPMRKETSTM